jgi:hypothetical protein
MSDLPIPTEAWRAAMKTYHREVRRNPGNAWQAAIRAGIEAWPGAECSEYKPAPTYIHLPIPWEAAVDK